MTVTAEENPLRDAASIVRTGQTLFAEGIDRSEPQVPTCAGST
jgi:hypothetical protein